MASTFSTSLKLELIGTGDQSGTWGTTTNNNLGTLLEQAITGVRTITMVNANYTLTSYNGVSDEARNAVLIVTGTNSAVRQIICPLVNKTYIVSNQTSGGYAITIGGLTGALVTVPNGITTAVYCDGTNFYAAETGSSGNYSVGGNLAVGGTTALSGALTYGGVTLSNSATGTGSMVLSASPALTGTPTAPTASPGTNTAQIATTAFVNAATSTLGTMSTQNANAVAITGGTITGITDLAVADGGTGASSFTANNVLLGNGASTFQVVAPGSNGNVLTSNGTTWQSTAPTVTTGLGFNGTVWNDVTSSRSFNTQYTNSRSYPIAVSARTTCSTGSAIAFIVNGVTISNFSWQFNGCGSFGGGFVIVPPGQTYQLNSGQSVDFWRELY